MRKGSVALLSHFIKCKNEIGNLNSRSDIKLIVGIFILKWIVKVKQCSPRLLVVFLWTKTKQFEKSQLKHLCWLTQVMIQIVSEKFYSKKTKMSFLYKKKCNTTRISWLAYVPSFPKVFFSFFIRFYWKLVILQHLCVITTLLSFINIWCKTEYI